MHLPYSGQCCLCYQSCLFRADPIAPDGITHIFPITPADTIQPRNDDFNECCPNGPTSCRACAEQLEKVVILHDDCWKAVAQYYVVERCSMKRKKHPIRISNTERGELKACIIGYRGFPHSPSILLPQDIPDDLCIRRLLGTPKNVPFELKEMILGDLQNVSDTAYRLAVVQAGLIAVLRSLPLSWTPAQAPRTNDVQVFPELHRLRWIRWLDNCYLSSQGRSIDLDKAPLAVDITGVEVALDPRGIRRLTLYAGDSPKTILFDGVVSNKGLSFVYFPVSKGEFCGFRGESDLFKLTWLIPDQVDYPKPYYLWDSAEYPKKPPGTTNPKGFFENRSKKTLETDPCPERLHVSNLDLGSLSGLCMFFSMAEMTAIRVFKDDRELRTLGEIRPCSTSVYFGLGKDEFITDVSIRYDKHYDLGVRGFVIDFAVFVRTNIGRTCCFGPNVLDEDNVRLRPLSNGSKILGLYAELENITPGPGTRIASLGIYSDDTSNHLPSLDWPPLGTPHAQFDPDCTPNMEWFLSRATLANITSVYLCRPQLSSSTTSFIRGLRIHYKDRGSETVGQYLPGHDQKISAGADGLIFEHDSNGNIVHVGCIAHTPDIESSKTFIPYGEEIWWWFSGRKGNRVYSGREANEGTS